MRLPLALLALSGLPVLATGCAKEHEYEDFDDPYPDSVLRDGGIPRPDAGRDGGLPRWDAGWDSGWPWPDAAWPLPPDGGFPIPWWPFDSGLPLWPDANIGWDSGWGWDAGADAAVPLQVGVETWVSNFTGTCPSTPTPMTPSSCRASSWHKPACYAVPSTCSALKESGYCLAQTALSSIKTGFVGLDTGNSCWNNGTTGALTSTSLAQIGGDAYRCQDGVVQQVALSDNSFDVAPLQCTSVFASGNALLVRAPQGNTVSRYESWSDLKAGKGSVVAFATSEAMFGANSKFMAAMWPESTQVDILAVDRSTSWRLFLQGLEFPVRGVDLTENGQLVVAAANQLFVYDALSGALLRRFSVPGIAGLSCTSGSMPSTVGVALTPRPVPLTARIDSIVQIGGGCMQEFTRYEAERGGPELVVVSDSSGALPTLLDQRTTPHILVLAGSPTSSWTVTLAAGANVERIIVTGTLQPVTVSGGNPTIDYQRTIGAPVEPWYELSGTTFRSRVEAAAGRAITELRGCRAGAARYVVSNVAPLCP